MIKTKPPGQALRIDDCKVEPGKRQDQPVSRPSKRVSTARRRLPPLNAVRAFEAAARHVNFALAADELSVTPGAVSRHVKALEAQIGRKLFDRYPQSLELTEFGRTWLPVVSEAFDTLESGTARL